MSHTTLAIPRWCPSFEYPAVVSGRVAYQEPNGVRLDRLTARPDSRPSFDVEQGVPADSAPDHNRLTGRIHLRLGHDGDDRHTRIARRPGPGRTGAASTMSVPTLDRAEDRIFRSESVIEGTTVLF
jgi:hypothetical protein